MAAFIPNRRDPAVTEAALAKVTDDKEREANDGFDGSWVAHPDLVPICREVFDRTLGAQPNQLDRQREVSVTADQLLEIAATPGSVTEAGVRGNVSVAVRYIASWLSGNGSTMGRGCPMVRTSRTRWSGGSSPRRWPSSGRITTRRANSSSASHSVTSSRTS